MNKKVSLGALFTLMAIVAAVTFSMTMVFSMRVFDDKVYNLKGREEIYRKLSEIDKTFRASFVGEIDDVLLMDSISAGYARGSGDTYARYFTADAYKKQSEVANGRIVGIGVTAEKDPSGYLIITNVYPGSTAESSGIQIGDLIIKIDDVDVKAENAAQMQELLQGEAGTKINLTTRRGTEDSTIEVTRRYVDIPSVFSKMLENNIGYMKLTDMSDTTDEQFIKQLEKLIEQGAKGFIVDLRGNGGGVFDSAVKILDRILPAQPIVTATYKSGGKVEEFATTDSKELSLPIVILTNEKTAREAEIITQVLKENGKAKVVGVNTLGKGTKQDTEKLYDGSAVMLTTAVYKTTNSETFNLVGIKPDYEVPLTAEQEKNFATLDEFTDPQLLKAMEIAMELQRAAEGAGAAQVAPAESGEEAASSTAESSSEESSEAPSSSAE